VRPGARFVRRSIRETRGSAGRTPYLRNQDSTATRSVEAVGPLDDGERHTADPSDCSPAPTLRFRWGLAAATRFSECNGITVERDQITEILLTIPGDRWYSTVLEMLLEKGGWESAAPDPAANGTEKSREHERGRRLLPERRGASRCHYHNITRGSCGRASLRKKTVMEAGLSRCHDYVMKGKHTTSLFTVLVLGACAPGPDNQEHRVLLSVSEATTEPAPPVEDPANCLDDLDPEDTEGNVTTGDSEGSVTGGQASCGNGIVEPEHGEQCDDANDSLWDYCHECRVARVMFTTEEAFDGRIWPEFGVYSADYLCSEAAPEGSGPWQAWISQPGASVLDRVDTTFTGQYIRSDGRTIAVGFDDLTDGSIARPINHNEYGQCVGGIDGVWTGTTTTGTAGASHCASWSSNAAYPAVGIVGVVNFTDARWTNISATNCEYAHHLYCLQNPTVAPIDNEAETDTETDGAGCGNGVVEGDEECDQGLMPDGITCNEECIVPVHAEAAADFDNMVNSDSSTWSYRYSDDTSLDGVYPLMPSFGDIHFNLSPINTPIQVWQTGNGGNPSYAGVNDTSYTLTYAGVTLPPGALDVHPPGGGLVVVSWLSDGNHVVDVQASISSLDPTCGNGVAWYITRNNDMVASSSYGSGDGVYDLLFEDITVTTGDRIHFIVSSNGDYHCDSTRLDALIKT